MPPYAQCSGAGDAGTHPSASMTQEEAWIQKYNAIVEFINKNRRNPSKYDDEERGAYVNWLRHNRKMYNSGEMKEERRAQFRELLILMKANKHKNQYE